MEEYFLHYIWKFQLFDKSSLSTQEGEPISIYKQGHHNHNQGPDFLESRLKIGKLEWSGNIEIHIKASDWSKHGHSTDPNYDNVILHVVYEGDKEIIQNGSIVPTLELKGKVDLKLYNRYLELKENSNNILCSNHLEKVNEISIRSMLAKALTERIEEKAGFILKALNETNNNWEETAFQSLAKSFGMKINSEAFLSWSKSLPYSLIRKYHKEKTKLYALVFGQAGFLEGDFSEDYFQQLLKEYQFLKHKHDLIPLPKHAWKFSKLRPANFPTVRLAQLAAMLSHSENLFTDFIKAERVESIVKKIKTEPNDYWTQHYDFDKPSNKKIRIGNTAITSVIINTVIPLNVAYGKSIDNQDYLDKALNWLEDLPAEVNKITKEWKASGVENKNAFDSQALIHLYNNYCLRKRCLDCVIGDKILRH